MVKGTGDSAIAGGVKIGRAPFLALSSSTNLVEVKIKVAGYEKDGKKTDPQPIYMEKGLHIKFGDNEEYSIGDDGKIYRNGKEVQSIEMNKAQYGVLGGISQISSEDMTEKAKDLNKTYYVLTGEDVRNSSEIQAGKNEEAQKNLQKNIINTLSRVGEKGQTVKLDTNGGHTNDISNKNDTLTVQLSKVRPDASGGRGGTVSVFMK